MADAPLDSFAEVSWSCSGVTLMYAVNGVLSSLVDL
jgi:hypothetical protein